MRGVVRLYSKPIVLAAAILAFNATSAVAQWTEQGPGPILNGQSEGIPTNPVSGAVTSIAVDPSDSTGNTVYVAAVNGGVWKTTDFLAANGPTWTELTDFQFPALSTNVVAVNPVNPNVVYAGTGSTSSDGFDGSASFGLEVSTDSGATWTRHAASTFAGRLMSSVLPLDANVVLVSTLFDGGGVYRSTDGGSSFTHISGAGGSGLPNEGVSEIVVDRVSGIVYCGVARGFGGSTGQEGVYRSTDGGQTWAPTNTGISGLGNAMRILLTVGGGTQGAVYAAVLNTSGGLSNVYRNVAPGTGTWTALGVPSPNIYPGAQSFLHGAIVADPSDPNVVYLSGDRQNSPFPNVNGANAFSGNVFRGFIAGTAVRWENIVDNGAHGTSPHADSRSLVFNPSGVIMHTCDGGVYELLDPNNANAARAWVSRQGNIRPTEFHSVANDPLSHVVIGGTQDVGTPMQTTAGSQTWFDFMQGDGGNVAVDDDQTAHAGVTYRYSSFTNLQEFIRSRWDPTNTFLGFQLVGLNIVSGAGSGLELHQFDPNIQFYNPYVLNNINPARMLIGTANIYESMNGGDSLTDFGFTGDYITSLSYGSRNSGTPMPDVFYVAAGSTIYHRVMLGGPITTLGAYPGGLINSLVMDPQNYRKLYVADVNGHVWASFNEGATWLNLTSNLPSYMTDVRALEVFSPNASIINTVLIAGGQGGVFQMRRPGAAGAVWTPLSTGMPHALVMDLHYDYVNNVLVAGTLGRGAWTLHNFFRGGGGTGMLARRPGTGTGTGTVGSGQWSMDLSALEPPPPSGRRPAVAHPVVPVAGHL